MQGNTPHRNLLTVSALLVLTTCLNWALAQPEAAAAWHDFVQGLGEVLDAAPEFVESESGDYWVRLEIAGGTYGSVSDQLESFLQNDVNVTGFEVQWEGQASQVRYLVEGPFGTASTVLRFDSPDPESYSFTLSAIRGPQADCVAAEDVIWAAAKVSRNPFPQSLAFEAVLNYCPLDPDVTDEYGQTPLIYAAGNGNTNVLFSLLVQGANPNHRTLAGWTPLMYAVRAFEPESEVVEVLLWNGADPTIVAPDGTRAIDLAPPTLPADLRAELAPQPPSAAPTSTRPRVGPNGSQVLGIDFPTEGNRNYRNEQIRGLASPVYNEYQDRLRERWVCEAGETIVWDAIDITRNRGSAPTLANLSQQIGEALNGGGYRIADTYRTSQPAFYPGMTSTAASELFVLTDGSDHYLMSYWTGTEFTYGSYLAVFRFRGPCN